MADNEAILGRIDAQAAESGRKSLSTPSAVCRRLDMPKVDQKQGALRPPRTAKVIMPFMDEMTDEAMAEFRKLLEAEDDDDLVESMTPRTA